MKNDQRPAEQENTQERKLTTLNIIVLFLSAYVLIAMLVDLLVELPPELSRLLGILDNAICVFFIFEFTYRLVTAENKLQFLKWGWIDLLASIPNVELFRAGRALRFIRILRILRAFRSIRHLMNYVYRNRAEGTFTTVLILASLLIIFASIAIPQFEVGEDSNIKTAEDALWWAYVTITTVGYGDKFPVTTGGRVVSVILMTGGVGLFGTFTGYVSSWFVEGRAPAKEES